MTTLEIEREQEQAEYTLTFRAMNTDIQLIIYGEDDTEQSRRKLEQAGGEVGLLFSQIEERLSRLKPESELSRLNRQGHLTHVSPLLFENVQAVLEMAR